MSLINQVLKDLDERRSAEYSEVKTDLDDLHFSHTPAKRKKVKSVLVIAGLLIAVIVTAGAGYYAFDQFSGSRIVSDAKNEQQMPVTPAVTANQPVVTKPKSVSASKPVVQTSVVEVSSRKVEKKEVAIDTPSRSENKTVPDSSDVAEETVTEEMDDTPVRFSRNSVPMRPEQKAELSYQDGYSHLKSHRYVQAEKSLRDALKVEQGHIKARELLAGIYIKQGRWVEASVLLREGLLYSPQHLTFTKLYARALMQLNQDKQAITVLKQRAPSMQAEPNYFALLAALHQRQNQHSEAAEIYAHLVTVNPQQGVWWVGMGISLEAMGRKQFSNGYDD